MMLVLLDSNALFLIEFNKPLNAPSSMTTTPLTGTGCGWLCWVWFFFSLANNEHDFDCCFEDYQRNGWNRFSTLNKSIPTIPSLEIAEIQELAPYIQNHDWTIKSVNNCWMFRMCWSWLIGHRAVHEVLKEDIKEMDSSRSFNIYTACLTHSWYKYRWKLE